ncbi:MAG: HNH endonuclease signature motif containing protein, partial [Marmoricola sp.]
DLALLGVDDAGTIETGPRAGAAVLAETIAAWCGRPATDLTVLPVLDTNAHHAGTGYAAPVTLKRHLAERDQHCLFPFCDRPARGCDCDQNAPTKSLRGRVVPDAAGGPTCSCNLVPLCRHHHRLKTHAGYTANLVEPGVVWWTTPWGHQFTVTRDGTVPVTTGAHRAPRRPICLA